MAEQQQQQKNINFYFIRHGETVDNITHTLQGQQPGKLSEKGVLEAQQAGKNLQNIKFDQVYCSDLKRCKDTFENIHMGLENKIKNIEYCPLLREVGLGVLEGKSAFDQNVNQFLKQMKRDQDFKVEQGESWNEVNKRGDLFWDKLKKECFLSSQQQQLQNVLVVSHKGYLNTLLSQIYLSGIRLQEGVRYNNQTMSNCEFIRMNVAFQENQYFVQDFYRQIL